MRAMTAEKCVRSASPFRPAQPVFSFQGLMVTLRLLLGRKLKSSTWPTVPSHRTSHVRCLVVFLVSCFHNGEVGRTARTIDIDPECSEHASHRRHLHVARGKHSLLSLDTDQWPSAAGVSLRYRRSRPSDFFEILFSWYPLVLLVLIDRITASSQACSKNFLTIHSSRGA